MNELSEELERWYQGGNYLTVGAAGRHIFYRQWGDVSAVAKDTLLILHGFPESSFSFRKVIDGLLADFKRVVVFDMLGYGFSDKPNTGYSYSLIDQADVALQVYQALSIRGGHILSHDMGTSVLTELVYRQVSGELPDFFDQGFQSFTFTNGSMVLRFAQLRFMQCMLLTKFGSILSQFTRYSVFKRSIQSAHSDDTGELLGEEDIQHLWESLTYKGGHRKSHLLIRYLNDRKRYEQSRWLPALSDMSKVLPIHFCWGTADQVARFEMVDYLVQEHCPQAIVSKMHGVGHFCQIASPDIWLKNIRNFYQGL